MYGPLGYRAGFDGTRSACTAYPCRLLRERSTRSATVHHKSGRPALQPYGGGLLLCILLYYNQMVDGLFDPDQLDEVDPFEIDRQAAHLFKHAPLGIPDIYEAFRSDPIFYPAKPPADWLMVAEIAGEVVVVPLAKPDSGNILKCRPIGCYPASKHLADRFRKDQRELK